MIVSIIICTCNRREHLRETLQAISKLEVPSGYECELVIIDNNSNDGTGDMVAGISLPNMPLQYYFEPKRGKTNAYNTSFKIAKGEILLFTDDDVRPEPDWIEGMIQPIVNGEAEVVAGGVRLAPHLQRDWMLDIHKAFLAENVGQNPYSYQGLVGANMAFSSRVLEHVPSFDTSIGPGLLGFGDDSLFGWQAVNAGYHMMLRHDIIVEHHPQIERLSRTSFLDTAKKHGQSSAYLDHHWHLSTVRYPKLQIFRKHIQLFLWRLLHPSQVRREEGAHPEEMHHVRSLWLYRQNLQERHKPRKYAEERANEVKPDPELTQTSQT